MEKSSFISRVEDEFMGLFNSPKSKLGYLGFNNFVVNLDYGLPNPFFQVNGGDWGSYGY